MGWSSDDTRTGAGRPHNPLINFLMDLHDVARAHASRLVARRPELGDDRQAWLDARAEAIADELAQLSERYGGDVSYCRYVRAKQALLDTLADRYSLRKPSRETTANRRRNRRAASQTFDRRYGPIIRLEDIPLSWRCIDTGRLEPGVALVKPIPCWGSQCCRVEVVSTETHPGQAPVYIDLRFYDGSRRVSAFWNRLHLLWPE